MRIFSFIAVALFLSTLSWGAESAVTSDAQALAQSSLGESTKDSTCPCRYQAENKRLDGDLGIDEDFGNDSDGTANPVR